MFARTVIASPRPLPDSVQELLGDDLAISERAFGQVGVSMAEVDDPQSLRERLRDAVPHAATAVITGALSQHPARLIMLDVDSTLTTTEAIDLLAEEAGAGEQVAAVTERAMRGELDFEASLRQRVATLKGLPTRVLEKVAPRMTLSPGARELITAAHAAGAVVGVTSGGFNQLVEPLAESLGLDFFNANQLGVTTVDGVAQLTGEVVGTVVDRAQKARDLRRFAADQQIDLSLSVAVGDGANDLTMLETSGLGIAYCAKPVTAARASVAIGWPRLDTVTAFALT